MTDVGSYALAQLEAAARDPRLDRSAGAAVADYLDYLDEADRVRMLALGAIQEIGARDITDEDDSGARQAVWERRQLAQHEERNGHPHINALTLIGMFGNMDGLVEQLAPSVLKMTARSVEAFVDETMNKAIAKIPEAHDIDAEQLAAVREAMRSALPDFDRKLPRVAGPAPARWEQVLTSVGLSPDPLHVVPQSLTDALGELTTLRNVLVHRAGRVDVRALADCPRLQTHLGYSEGQFVRIDRRAYRRYSAALRAYGIEVQRRLCRASPSLRDVIKIDLSRWESYHYIGA